LQNGNYKISKPEFIPYDFNSIVKYFNAVDKEEAERISQRLNFPLMLETSKYIKGSGQIEVWVKN
jgi:hypothetical protein